MKRFSKVVRHPHKLTQWSAGIRKKADKNKKKARVMFCEEHKVTTDDIRNNVDGFSDTRSICRAWDSLRQASNDVETLMNLLEVLLNSCVNPCECVCRAVEPQGDIRSMICDKHLVCQLLVKLSGHWEEAIDMFSLSVPVRESLMKHKPTLVKGVSVELLRLIGWTSALGEEEISGYHLSVLMPWLNQQENLTARILCDDWERLPNQFTGKVLFAFSHHEALRSWMDALLTLSSQDGSYLLWVLLDQGFETKVMYDHVAPILCVAFYQRRALGYNDRVIQFIMFLLKGISVSRLNCLIHLEEHIGKRKSDNYASYQGLDDFDVIQPMLDYYTPDDTLEIWGADFSTELWSYSVDRMQHYDLDKTESKYFAKLMRNQCDYLTNNQEAMHWFIDASALAFKTVDQKFYGKLEGILYYRVNSNESLTKWQAIMKMAMILCSPKMEAKSKPDPFLLQLDIEEAEGLFLSKLLPSAWQHIDHFCRSGNRAELMAEGLDRCFDAKENYISNVIRGLNAAPSTTLNTLVALGSFPENDISDVFRWLEYHPLYGQDESAISQRCSIAVHFSNEYPSVDLPRKLIKALEKNAEAAALRKEVKAKEMLKLEAAEMRMVFTAISDHLSETMQAALHPQAAGPVDTHSISLVNSAKRNRRGGKRALRKYSAKGESARLLHPSNINWLRNPKSFWRPAVWMKGVSMKMDIDKIGEVTIETEHRFEEILKMGTYVNSCLSLGSFNQYSAIANALDANKRVLYMRDANGQFLARQLLAITKDRKLACFEVYQSGGCSDRQLILDFFSAVDVAFAEELGVVIQVEQEYEIEKVVCKEWYDDGIWNPLESEQAS